MSAPIFLRDIASGGKSLPTFGAVGMSKSVLARKLFPRLSRSAALAKMLLLIQTNAQLKKRLLALGWSLRSKRLTGAQVSVIVKYLKS